MICRNHYEPRIASTGEKTSGCRDPKSRPRCMDNHVEGRSDLPV